MLTDTDPGTYALSFDAGAAVTLGFTDNFLVNGPGADLVLFELGVPDSFTVTLNGITKTYLSADTGSSAGGFALNAAAINLDDFGIAANAQLSSVVIGLDIAGSTGTVPSLSLVGALNSADVGASAPEPSFVPILSLIGFAGYFGTKRHFANRRA